ncbi:hypothetical protein OPV22_027357 [Ensete ventricosum]|uniref:Secreted protein n=1 Tax=Ensete ventricosum TaxID=4639 RepID=A0AAV8PRU7_ENSVE|nr:hypothetical protein OPV22_027357 [Ensete ventricosum]
MGMVNKWPADLLHLLGHGFAAAALSAGNARFPPNHLTRISRTMWWVVGKSPRCHPVEGVSKERLFKRSTAPFRSPLPTRSPVYSFSPPGFGERKPRIGSNGGFEAHKGLHILRIGTLATSPWIQKVKFCWVWYSLHPLGVAGNRWWDLWNGSVSIFCGMRSLTAEEFEIHQSDSGRRRRRR